MKRLSSCTLLRWLRMRGGIIEEEERRLKEIEKKEKADRLAAEQKLLDNITATVIATAALETAETVRRNKEAEEIRVAEEIRMAEEKAAQEAIRMEAETRLAQEAAELAAPLQDEEEAKAADEATRLAAETHSADTGLLDIPVVVSAKHPEEAYASEGTVSLVPFLLTILHTENLASSPATSSVVAELKGFMTQVAVNVERNVNMVMKSLEENKKIEEERRRKDEERKEKEDFYDSSLATLFDLVKKGEEDMRKEKKERLRLEQKRLAREAQEEARRQEQFQEMLRVMQGRIPRSPASTSSPPPPPPP